MAGLISYLLIGRLFIYLAQKFPFNKLPILGSFFNEGRFLEELFSCDLCLGFWVYSFFAFGFKINLLHEYFYISYLSEFITGAAVSFLVHIFVLGLKAKFETIIVE